MIRNGKIICDDSYCSKPVIKETKWRCDNGHDVAKELAADHKIFQAAASNQEISHAEGEETSYSYNVTPQKAHERAFQRHRKEPVTPIGPVPNQYM